MLVFLKKIFLVSVLAAMLSLTFQNASAHQAGKKTLMLHPKDTPGSSRPDIPPLIQLSAEIDRDVLTITSSENVTARVTITDYTEEECYFDRLVSISPTYSCSLPDSSEILTLHIFIGDKEYIGNLDPE